ncbi:3-phosphoshikimate 1-carboxyvinyltransferase [Ehrlichia canis]|nr:3-phosphoshikimate 1-carboxyvinyltransferase [Ehrlichia canis]UKC53166.1 3-phosphoshikimate 1-carboxyvinyltransferase [Ehrlichia canis]UKC54103.1 3-phosphoshikimate 1-carboxyvinyltransferase [Ehrlichia canis]UKC55039.1 3-phosphoshikimate 1-carboxyvinyltransferase [Ehrlichia canis]
MFMVLISEKIYHMCGHVDILKDNLMSHATLVLASQVIGVTKIYDLVFNDDIMLTIKALDLLGVKIKYNKSSKVCTVEGMGVGGFLCPKDALYLNNPAIYMMIGCLASCPFTSFLYGNSNISISKVMKPLLLMGARFIANDNKFPAALVGYIDMLPIRYVAKDDETKMAMIFAALNTFGTTTIISTTGKDSIVPILQYLNVGIECFINKNYVINISGQRELYSKDMCIPNDFFCMLSFIAVALVLKESEVTILNVLLTDRIKSFCKVLIEMGGNLFFVNHRNNAIGEKVADLLIKGSVLQGMKCLHNNDFDIDEYLFIVIIAAYADGITVLSNVLDHILMDKRLKTVINELVKAGIRIDIEGNRLIIYGCSDNILDWNLVDACYDFKMTILFLVIGMISKNVIKIKNIRKTRDLLTIIELFNKHGAGIKII